MAARLLLLFAALFGAAGVAGAAYAAHGAEARLAATAAAIALVHAPALLALALAGPGRIRAAALPGLFWIGGVLLFSGDLAARLFLETRLFPNAAPAGGVLLMLGWLSLAPLAVLPAGKGR
ncbi:DUF423 domain-containing protein [Aureimonas populi]|uniref:DUF423 domain-containing protein n=1 Tax=Aureimonas populi TaxID=1701758 RepID=A0ABW5CGI8_9HYPH|nr:DUF423 domain-containing protein [Aureimonas populi]